MSTTGLQVSPSTSFLCIVYVLTGYSDHISNQEEPPLKSQEPPSQFSTSMVEIKVKTNRICVAGPKFGIFRFLQILSATYGHEKNEVTGKKIRKN